MPTKKRGRGAPSQPQTNVNSISHELAQLEIGFGIVDRIFTDEAEKLLHLFARTSVAYRKRHTGPKPSKAHCFLYPTADLYVLCSTKGDVLAVFTVKPSGIKGTPETPEVGYIVRCIMPSTMEGLIVPLSSGGAS